MGKYKRYSHYYRKELFNNYLPEEINNPDVSRYYEVKSLSELEINDGIQFLNDRITFFESKMPFNAEGYIEAKARYIQSDNSITSQKNIINIEQNKPENKNSLVSQWFRGEEAFTTEAKHKIFILENELKKEIEQQDFLKLTIEAYRKEREEVRFLKKLILSLKKDLKIREKLKLEAEKLSKNKLKIEKLKAAEADLVSKSRTLAQSIRKKLMQTKFCPYCLDPLVKNVHADHIYPISRGGRSVVSNMVNICQKCNIKKSSMTLNQFIDKYALDRSLIYENLKKLQKDF